MSKIGRKPIDTGSVSITVQGNEIHYKGKKLTGIHILPDELKAEFNDKKLSLKPIKKDATTNRLWGLHRALLANKIKGADQNFEKQIRIVGLGFKAVLQGNSIQFSLGYSHKIDYPLPQDVTVEIDKSGQILTFKSPYKEVLGEAWSKVCALREVEPYKGTGIHSGKAIIRKAGKAKSA